MNKYTKYFSEFIPFENLLKTEMVFNEELIYESKSKYLDGVKLMVDNNYLVPYATSIESALTAVPSSFIKSISSNSCTDVLFCSSNL